MECEEVDVMNVGDEGKRTGKDGWPVDFDGVSVD